MKTIQHFILGLVSSLSFAAGLHRVAARLDPLSRQAGADTGVRADASALCCVTLPCAVRDHAVS